MAIELSTPAVGELPAVVHALREWQRDTASMQLHPGDLGWFWQFGDDKMAGALRTWRRDGNMLAIGLLDGPTVLRLTVAPEVWDEDVLARRVVADVADPQRGVLPPGEVAIETPDGTRVQDLLSTTGWSAGEGWTPLRHDLSVPLAQTALRIEVIVPGQESEFTAVHRSAWGTPRFTDELWRTMTAGLPYTDARCLLGYDDEGVAVAGVTVWAAGPRRPGLLEPMGVHADHRGRGYGTAICVAAVSELEAMGSSSALVCTLSSLTGAVATYEAAGFRQLPQRLDRTRVLG